MERLPQDPAKKLVPRQYQEDTLSAAVKGNVISWLPTSTGKTFISVLLIRWISVQPSSKGKVVVFLAPKVALVEQQAAFIKRNTSLRVISLHGQMNLDLLDRAAWKKRFESFDVMVLTSNLFLELLVHTLWSLSKVSCLILDECHHARKRDAYVSIMAEYRHVPPESRPKIFGMTASPIWNINDAEDSLRVLEKCLDAQVVDVSIAMSKFPHFSLNNIVKSVKQYESPPAEYDYPTPRLKICLDYLDAKTELDCSLWATITTRYDDIYNVLGPYCAELYIYTEVSRLANSSRGSPSDGTRELYSVLFDFEAHFSINPVPLNWCSPKLCTLLDVLLEHYEEVPDFQGIVFVKMRAVAIYIARLLPRLLDGAFGCSLITGNSSNGGSITMPSTPGLEEFRTGATRLLIATSVAEEGLDFPACDLVIRFDPIQNMVEYLQSRGRARSKVSKFIVMIQQDDTEYLEKYRSLVENEPTLESMCSNQATEEIIVDSEEGDVIYELQRERFVVPSTGAVLTYDTSIGLLNYLCSLIPCDAYTPLHRVVYTGDFEATLNLPSSLPLPASDLVYIGPLKHSKREAKRAVAFACAKKMYELGILDKYLLPVTSAGSDQDDNLPDDAETVPPMMNILVCYPWFTDDDGKGFWIHPIFVDGVKTAGVITGTLLPDMSKCPIQCENADVVYIGAGTRSHFSIEEMCVMRAFTKLVIYHTITLSPVKDEPSVVIVPIMDSTNIPDFAAMRRLLEVPFGSSDWSTVTERDFGRVLITIKFRAGRPLLLQRIRRDISAMSIPPPGTREELAGYSTYYGYILKSWGRQDGYIYQDISTDPDEPLLEALILPRYQSEEYQLCRDGNATDSRATVLDGCMIPQSCCRWVDLSPDVRSAYSVLPPLCRRINDLYRAQKARDELSLSFICNELMIEALTLPCTRNKSRNNQRLETLGDAVLQLCTTVHLFNKYPYHHEGHLTLLRIQQVSNRSLLRRAKFIGLEHFLIGEMIGLQRVWKYTQRDGDGSPLRHARREFPRKSLEDCMEAILGAAFTTGGIDTALHAGTSLGVAFGGPTPWLIRYSGKIPNFPVPAAFDKLETALGYRFRNGALLLEAVTHPSFTIEAGGSSYQRLEFLGDALLDLVVVKYLYDKFPEATSDQLSRARARAICSIALAFVAVQRLEVQKFILFNSVELSKCIEEYVPLLAGLSGEDVVKYGWKCSPPKAISDVFESILGALLIDCEYNYDKATFVVEYVMEDILLALSPSVSRDPASKFIVWISRKGCLKSSLQRIPRKGHNTDLKLPPAEDDDVCLFVHGIAIAVMSMVGRGFAVAKALVYQEGLVILRDSNGPHGLPRLCDCKTRKCG